MMDGEVNRQIDRKTYRETVRDRHRVLEKGT